jgi:DNA repair protein RAD7
LTEPSEAIPEDTEDADLESPETEEQIDEAPVIPESSTTRTTRQTVTVEITTSATSTPSKRKSRASTSKKKKPTSDDDFENSDNEEVDTSKYGRASFSHKKRAPAVQPGKIDFCHVCSQRFTITAYTKQSPDGEGLLCHKCGAVEQSVAKKEAPKRKTTKIGKGTAKMILEGKESRIWKLQDVCIKVSRIFGSRREVDLDYCESYS